MPAGKREDEAMAGSTLPSSGLLGPARGRLAAGACAAATAAALASGGRVAQPLGYHAFADGRTLLGVPNALDVLSSGAFAVVGLAGMLLALARGRALERAGGRGPWLVLFAGVLAVAGGSAWYHLAPSNATLFWDRLAMAVGFAGFVAALVGDRAGAPAGARLLAPLAFGSAASVVYWFATEQAGAGDLRPYLLVQVGSVAAVPAVLVRFPRREGTAGWCWATALYLVAKVLEGLDGEVLGASGLVSGHTLKHVVAAAAIGALVAMLARRTAGRGRARG
jgi:hypothetical protein